MSFSSSSSPSDRSELQTGRFQAWCVLLLVLLGPWLVVGLPFWSWLQDGLDAMLHDHDDNDDDNNNNNSDTPTLATLASLALVSVVLGWQTVWLVVTVLVPLVEHVLILSAVPQVIVTPSHVQVLPLGVLYRYEYYGAGDWSSGAGGGGAHDSDSTNPTLHSYSYFHKTVLSNRWPNHHPSQQTATTTAVLASAAS